MADIHTGMKVVGVDGHNIGRVKAVKDDYFVLDKPKAPDLAVPFPACLRVEGNVVWLRIKANSVHRQGWKQSE